MSVKLTITELKRLIKKDKGIYRVIKYLFLETRKIVGVLGKEQPLMITTLSGDIDLASEIYKRLISPRLSEN